MFRWVPLCLGASLSPAYRRMTTTPISKLQTEDCKAQMLPLWPLPEQGSVHFCWAWVWTERKGEVAGAVLWQELLFWFSELYEAPFKNHPFWCNRYILNLGFLGFLSDLAEDTKQFWQKRWIRSACGWYAWAKCGCVQSTLNLIFVVFCLPLVPPPRPAFQWNVSISSYFLQFFSFTNVFLLREKSQEISDTVNLLKCDFKNFPNIPI